MGQKQDFIESRKAVTFLDLFAGAGGISEGFLQSYTDSKYYDFILASDINENCELTHRVRYNYQLGLGTKFITKDIMSDDFLPLLKKELKGKRIDVVTGGPSCQSFSLSGRRRKHDKRDNLFEHYLKVISFLRPKYFVMENVKGILTKDHGRFKDEILSQIRSIVNREKSDDLYAYVSSLLGKTSSAFVCKTVLSKLHMEIDEELESNYQKEFISLLDEQFKSLTKTVDYKISKSNSDIATIRHGLLMLTRSKEREDIRARLVQEKAFADIDNDAYENPINDFIDFINDDAIIDRMVEALDRFPQLSKQKTEEFKTALSLYPLTLDATLEEIRRFAVADGTEKEFDGILDSIRLYRIEKPVVVLSSDYGVPQNRERVLFIGCRYDQKLITEIPATVAPDEKVTVYEAIADLDFIGNGETKLNYEPAKPIREFSGLVRKRQVTGAFDEEQRTFAEWSRYGRLSHRFTMEHNPTYVISSSDFAAKLFDVDGSLFNHQTSSQNTTVQRRLEIIAKHGSYDDECKAELIREGLKSGKRNYTVLNPESQSPTVVTMPDDFIHYSRHRAMTVREMARLQSFDDTFVFQGKRQTGGEKRKSEIPQYTLVGNAVPPLMARAIGNEILKAIK